MKEEWIRVPEPWETYFQALKRGEAVMESFKKSGKGTFVRRPETPTWSKKETTAKETPKR